MKGFVTERGQRVTLHISQDVRGKTKITHKGMKIAGKDPRTVDHKPNTGFQFSEVLALKLELTSSHLAHQHAGKSIWTFPSQLFPTC